jgi:AAA domain
MSIRSTGVLTAEQWMTRAPDSGEGIIFGGAEQRIIESLTKNLIEGPEKSFKTTFALRLFLAASAGMTAYEQLPLSEPNPRRILYVHGELAPGQISQRTTDAARGLPRPLENFMQVRDLDIHLIDRDGRGKLSSYVGAHKPTDLVLDPWQSFITGYDENDFKEVSKATRFLDGLISEHGLTAHIVTHTGKNPKRGTRGHSSLAGWRDTLIKVKRGGNLLNVEVEPRWAAPLELFTLRFENGLMVPTSEHVYSPSTWKLIEALKEYEEPVERGVLTKDLGMDRNGLRQALHRARKEQAPIITPNGKVGLLP